MTLLRKLLIIAGLAAFLWIVDSLRVALPLDECLADLDAFLLSGVTKTPHCQIAPACSGLRTMLCGAFLAPLYLPGKRWVRVLQGIALGFLANFLRICAIEAAYASGRPELAHTLHETALFFVILPTFALGIYLLWERCQIKEEARHA